jgi:two-component system sensor histidine kinase RegB
MNALADPLIQQPPVATRRGGVRMRTLVRIRWIAIAGQSAAVLFVRFVLGFETPMAICLALIGASILVNLGLTGLLARQRMASPWEATIQLAFDIIQLSLLVGFTGGIINPFVIFLIAPTTVAAAALPPRNTSLLSGLTLISACILTVSAAPLPWTPGDPLDLPPLYRLGLLAAVITGVGFNILYAWRVSIEEDRLRMALAAAEAVLAREQRVAALGGLAAAAAHELGTPLATIQITAKEMVEDLPKNTPAAEDAQLILSQAQRCRDILKSLSSGEAVRDRMHERMSLDALLHEAAGPHTLPGVEVNVNVTARSPNAENPPVLTRRQEIVHALGAFIENAASFAESRVDVNAIWSSSDIAVVVLDDGPGFSEMALAHLGEPYISQRDPDSGGGLGLGFFIAKTLVERSGGRVSFDNRAFPAHGAMVRAVWPRTALEAAVTG